LHVYCEKPLTHTVREARVLTETARKMNVATQMGTQNHEHPGYLKTIELVKQGAIGPVREAHVITDRPGTFWDQGLTVPPDKPEIPANLHWDLWLGAAAQRPYHPAYVPFKWRGWWDFGCGAIGDMAIHLMDPVFMALDLGGPVKVTSTGPPVLPDSGPIEMITKFEFAARGDLPPCTVYWYEGLAKPEPEIAQLLPINGCLFLGDDGKLACPHGHYPTLYKGDEVFPQTPMKAEPFADSHHHLQWIDACKTGSPTGSNFDYAGPFTEIVLLGNVAYRTGETVHYDPQQMKITNVPRANALLDKEYRAGWEV
jgi:predicted dehydrogenase